MADTIHVDPLLTTADLARRWSMHPASLTNMRSQKRGPAYVKLGKAVRYRIADIEAFEASTAV